jgi:hypothetical protein
MRYFPGAGQDEQRMFRSIEAVEWAAHDAL